MSARTRRMGALALCLLLCGGPAALAAPGPQAETPPFMLLTDDGSGGGAPEPVKKGNPAGRERRVGDIRQGGPEQ